MKKVKRFRSPMECLRWLSEKDRCENDERGLKLTGFIYEKMGYKVKYDRAFKVYFDEDSEAFRNKDFHFTSLSFDDDCDYHGYWPEILDWLENKEKHLIPIFIETLKKIVKNEWGIVRASNKQQLAALVYLLQNEKLKGKDNE